MHPMARTESVLYSVVRNGTSVTFAASSTDDYAQASEATFFMLLIIMALEIAFCCVLRYPSTPPIESIPVLQGVKSDHT